MLDDETLHKSSIVANCAMNRQRQLVGSNGYVFELKFDIASWLSTQLEVRPIRWLDVCCGTGMALIDAVQLSETLGHSNQLSIVGIDLAGHFVGHNYPQLELKKTSIESWDPQGGYDLVTCVHGLHYIGDKLAAVKKMVNCLTEDGLFFASIDLANLRFQDGRLAGRIAVNRLREHGIDYDKNNRLIR